MPSKPLVSCIMPTIKARDEFRKEAVACFEAQTYPNRELVTVFDPGTVGAKRNMACSRARGEIICHWDDDDWSHPERIADQIERLLSSEHPVTGYHSMIFVNGAGRRWKYTGTPGFPLGTSLCYFKDCWRKTPFVAINEGEDVHFMHNWRASTVEAGEMMQARIHAGNTSDKSSRLSHAEYQEIVA